MLSSVVDGASAQKAFSSLKLPASSFLPTDYAARHTVKPCGMYIRSHRFDIVPPHPWLFLLGMLVRAHKVVACHEQSRWALCMDLNKDTLVWALIGLDRKLLGAPV